MAQSSTSETFLTSGRRIRIDGTRRWTPDFRALFGARQLIALLSRRDITARHRQTILGSFWIFVGPLVSAGLFTFVFGNVAKLPSDGVPYFAFSFAGLLGWNLFAQTLQKATNSLNSSSSLISKIYFPRLVIPFATVLSNLINLAVSGVLMAVVVVLYDVDVSLRILLLPFWLTLALVLAMGIGLMLGSLAVSYRDVNFLTPVFTSLLLYLSPVAYSTTAVPENLQTLYRLNPMATIIEGCRWSLLQTDVVTIGGVGYATVVAVSTLLVGMIVFTRLEPKFADVI